MNAEYIDEKMVDAEIAALCSECDCQKQDKIRMLLAKKKLKHKYNRGDILIASFSDVTEKVIFSQFVMDGNVPCFEIYEFGNDVRHYDMKRYYLEKYASVFVPTGESIDRGGDDWDRLFRSERFAMTLAKRDANDLIMAMVKRCLKFTPEMAQRTKITSVVKDKRFLKECRYKGFSIVAELVVYGLHLPNIGKKTQKIVSEQLAAAGFDIK